jgi:hypothetical protein
MPFPPAPGPEKKGSLLSFKNLKKLRWPALVASALGGPYAYFESGEITGDFSKAVREWTTSSDNPATTASVTSTASLRPDPRFGAYSTGAVSSTGPTQLAEIFRFDVSPSWVTSQWHEVTLGMADVELSGHRVMLVTGKNPADLAGSLTYYFNRDNAVQRIRFEGVTGDPRPLVAELATKYRFVRCRADVAGAEVYQVHRDGKARGDLRIRSAPIVRADSPLGRYSVSLAIDRPNG